VDAVLDLVLFRAGQLGLELHVELAGLGPPGVLAALCAAHLLLDALDPVDGEHVVGDPLAVVTHDRQRRTGRPDYAQDEMPLAEAGQQFGVEQQEAGRRCARRQQRHANGPARRLESADQTLLVPVLRPGQDARFVVQARVPQQQQGQRRRNRHRHGEGGQCGDDEAGG
jgi:hypothetical protein